jgi:predicted small lipoprotein YifL
MKRQLNHIISLALIASLTACAVPGPITMTGPSEAEVIADQCIVEARGFENEPAVYRACIHNRTASLAAARQNAVAQQNAAVAGGVIAGLAAVIIGAALLGAGSGGGHYHHWHRR